MGWYIHSYALGPEHSSVEPYSRLETPNMHGLVEPFNRVDSWVNQWNADWENSIPAVEHGWKLSQSQNCSFQVRAKMCLIREVSHVRACFDIELNAIVNTCIVLLAMDDCSQKSTSQCLWPHHHKGWNDWSHMVSQCLQGYCLANDHLQFTSGGYTNSKLDD